MSNFKVGDVVTSCTVGEEGYLEVNFVSDKYCTIEVWNDKKQNITLPFDEVESHWKKQGEESLKNIYNLDTDYFKKNLERIIRDIESYTPEELERAFNILADVAKHEIINKENTK